MPLDPVSPGHWADLFVNHTFIMAFLLGAIALLVLINVGQAWARREPLNLWCALYLSSISAAITLAWIYRGYDLPADMSALGRLLVLLAMGSQCALIWQFTRSTSPPSDNRFFVATLLLLLAMGLALSPLPTELAASVIRVLYLLSTFLCIGQLVRLHQQHVAFATHLLIAKLFVGVSSLFSWWLMSQLQPAHALPHWLVLINVILESLIVTYALVMVSIRQRQERLQQHYDRSLTLRLKQQYNTTLKRVDHELRSPLSAIVGIAELLLDTPLNKNQRDQISTMQRASESLLKWLNRLNDWRALQIGRLHFDAIPFNFEQLLQSICDDARIKAEDRRIRLGYTPHPNTPTLIKGDPARLKQIISGMLEMALYYSEKNYRSTHFNSNKLSNGVGDGMTLPPGNPAEEVEVTDIRLSLKPNRQRNRWRLEIIDDHSGLQPEDLQIDITDQQDTDAGHLGSVQRNWLIAKALAKHIGGELDVDIDQGRVRFNCELRLTRHSLLQHHENQYTELLRDKRLLVVDDSSSSRKVIAKRAESWGMKVTCVPNGHDALVMLKTMKQLSADFDAMILDFDMPGMTGLELAQRIAEFQGPEHTPVMIMLSGASAYPSEERARNASVKRVLTKPISSQSLKITLAEELTLHQARALSNTPHSATRQE